MDKRIINKKGINLVSLVCLIAIMVIILGTIVFSFDNIYIETRKKEFANELYTIQKMVDEYHFKNNSWPITEEIKENKNEYEIDLYELGVNETTWGRKKDAEGNDRYILEFNIEEPTYEVKYEKGVIFDGKMYKKLSDYENELKKVLGLK